MMTSDDLIPCDLCNGRRVTGKPGQWKLCPCSVRYAQRAALTNLAPAWVRGVDPYLPEPWYREPPFPLDAEHFYYGDDLTTFRYLVWRSLEPLAEQRRTTTHGWRYQIEIMDSWRLHEISFQRDPKNQYTGVLDLLKPDLLILREGFEPSRQFAYARELVRALLAYRRDEHKTTWVYTPTHLPPLSEAPARPDTLHYHEATTTEDAPAPALAPGRQGHVVVGADGRLKRIH